ncbi:hypothetical protein [Planctomycetes bacterium K23_9]|uniref:Uncharacterized protein n=1 Tax=Stieleria marina TaxID=1930275 RepID=A0A517NPN8_9BACT|nr:hypothetical protein K239x_10400 [Planctomycetes bacterium K23_9]
MLRMHLRNAYPIVIAVLFASTVVADEDAIRFDMPSTVVATQVNTGDSIADSSNAELKIVQCQLRLSSLVASPSLPRIDQWLVRCTPRDFEMHITDYAPRTETRSALEGPVEFKITDEESRSLGMSLNGDYCGVVDGSLGADVGTKNLVTKQYKQVAAVQAVTAAGTIDRGRGVYFKLRWTATQVLEGEKVFTLSMRVPVSWRGGLIDVDVTAQSAVQSFGRLDTHIKTIGAAKFVVATYRAGDAEAGQRASEFASAEQRLRRISEHVNHQKKPSTLPSMLRHVAAKLDLDSPPPTNGWINRLTTGQADPYLDREISRLPMKVRVAAIEYHDKKREFSRLAVASATQGS